MPKAKARPASKRAARERSNAYYLHYLDPATRTTLELMAAHDHDTVISLAAQINFILDQAADTRLAQAAAEAAQLSA